ncbi:MAG: 4'-phosphopantetheinyl transferase superfamily protein [Moraxellaceae bacterium]|nr:4'-phosphopantetheinyl transferase superfamily protein [Moraxellaceae bacterium]
MTTTVDVWWADLTAGAALASVVLTQEERRREQAFRTAAARQQYGVSKTLIRCVLSRYIGLEPRHLEIAVSPEGKPFLATATDLVFNVSHAGGLIVCAVSRALQLGIDIEWRGGNVDMPALAENYCSASERELLAGTVEAEPFYKLWTLKEAYAKACGQGLALPLADIGFDISDTTPRLSAAPGNADAEGDWHFACHASAGYVLSLAIRCFSARRPRLCFLPASGLINGTDEACLASAVPDFLFRT